ncbi:MAG: hypothetical protein COV38_01055 [Bdellovibrionales bacterium CG11_big_fil_rev_8_21_14_0_20_38_13]|nr:MAG: hypothetical protein COV38_01055 [Bdellovibrionales bacterium CG11_big_fil_rev_8_21_14_0_20_38_13]
MNSSSSHLVTAKISATIVKVLNFYHDSEVMVKASLFKALLVSSLIGLGGCASYDQFRYVTEEFEIPSKVFNADYPQTWQAVLQIMARYDLELKNQEAGVIKTRWIDNTLEVNFADSFGGNDAVKAARFKLIINVVKGFRGDGEVSKVTIFKRQLVEQDFLQGWKVKPTDGILEQSLLYRVERLLSIDKKLKKIEKEKAKELEASF